MANFALQHSYKCYKKCEFCFNIASISFLSQADANYWIRAARKTMTISGLLFDID